MKMDPEVKAVWIAALRSGKYQQGRGFCCHGVLCDLLGVEWQRLKHTGLEARLFYGYGHGTMAMPAARELDRAKLHEDAAWELANMNDNGEPFAEIADYIEANL
jgi:hypothetical protein